MIVDQQELERNKSFQMIEACRRDLMERFLIVDMHKRLGIEFAFVLFY